MDLKSATTKSHTPTHTTAYTPEAKSGPSKMDLKSATTKTHTPTHTSSKMTSPMTMDFVSCATNYTSSTKAVMDRFADVMDKECEMPNNFLHEQIKMMKDTPKVNRDSCGWFVLYDNKKNLLCVAFLFQARINNIWTPKRFRKMGYATELFRCIGEFYKEKKTPIWVIAYKYLDKILEKAGWKCQMDGVEDEDPKSEYNYSPEWCYNEVAHINDDGMGDLFDFLSMDQNSVFKKTADLIKKSYAPIVKVGGNFNILKDLKIKF